MVDTECTIVADLEAGIGTLTRLAEAAVDVTLVVVEPTPRAIDVGRRAVAVAGERRQGKLLIVANKIVGDEDRRRIEEAFPDSEVILIPSDAAVDAADREGLSPVDVAPTAPAVLAIEGILDRLARGC